MRQFIISIGNGFNNKERMESDGEICKSIRKNYKLLLHFWNMVRAVDKHFPASGHSSFASNIRSSYESSLVPSNTDSTDDNVND